MLAPILLAGAALGFLLLRRSGERASGSSALATEVRNAVNPAHSGYSPEQQIMVALSAYEAGFFRTAIDLAEMAADRIDDEPPIAALADELPDDKVSVLAEMLDAALRGLDVHGQPLQTSDQVIALKLNVAALFAAEGVGNPHAIELLAAAATDIAMRMDQLGAPGADVFGGGHQGPGNIIWPGPAPVAEAA